MKKSLIGYGYLQKNISGSYDLVSCETGKILETMSHDDASLYVLESGCFVNLGKRGPKE